MKELCFFLSNISIFPSHILRVVDFILPCLIFFFKPHMRSPFILFGDVCLLGIALFKVLFWIISKWEGIEVTTKNAKWKRDLENFLEELEDQTEECSLRSYWYYVVHTVPPQCSGKYDRISKGNDWVVQWGKLILRNYVSQSCNGILASMLNIEIAVLNAFYLIVEKCT